MSLYDRLIELSNKEVVRAEDIPERREIELSLYLASQPNRKEDHPIDISKYF